MTKAYYICDTETKTRLSVWHRSLSAAQDKCERLNRENDRRAGKVCARYFCGDWCDIRTAQKCINEPNDWPWRVEWK